MLYIKDISHKNENNKYKMGNCMTYYPLHTLYFFFLNSKTRNLNMALVSFQQSEVHK